MSKGENTPAAPSGQVQPENHQQEFYRLACVALRLFLLLITETAARNFGRRLESWSGAVIIPAQGYGSLSAVQAILDIGEEGAERFVKRNNIPAKKPGRELLYKLSDLTEKFEPPDTKQ